MNTTTTSGPGATARRMALERANSQTKWTKPSVLDGPKSLPGPPWLEPSFPIMMFLGTCLVSSRRWAAVMWLVAVLGALAVVVGDRAHATPDAIPTVQVVPSSISVVPGDVVQVAVVLDNPTDAPASVQDIRVVAPPRVSIGAVSGLPVLLAPRSSRVVTLDVGAGQGAEENSVGIIVEFGGNGDTTRLAAASLSVKPAAASVALEAAFLVFPAKLNDGDSRRATVRVTNPTGVAFTDLRLLAVDSDDAYLVVSQSTATRGCPADQSRRLLTCLADLAPGSSHLVDLEVRAHPSVRTGTQQVGVIILASGAVTEGATELPIVSTVAMHDIELAVFGVDVLSPFGVGALFLLPGLLAVAVFLAATRWVYPRVTSGLPEKVDPKDLTQMPVIVLVGVLAYVLVWVFWREDLTRRTSTLAVVLLFGLGILMGLAAWLVVALLYRQLVGRRRFRRNVEPQQVLQTLAHRGEGLTFPSLRTQTSPNAIYLHLGQTDGLEYVAPQIAYDLADATDSEERAFNNARRVGDIDTILNLHKAGKVTLEWTAPAEVQTYAPESLPTLLGTADLLRETS